MKPHRFEFMADPYRDMLYAIDSTVWSRGEYSAVLNEFQEDLTLKKPKLERYPELHNDFWHLLWKGLPRLKGYGEVRPSVQVHVAILNMITGLEEFKQLRGYTTYDRVAAMVAARHLKYILENLPEEMQQAMQMAEQAGMAAEGDQEALQNMRQYYKQMLDSKAGKRLLAQLRKQGEEQRKKAEASQKELDAAVQITKEVAKKHESEIRSILRKGMDKSKDDAQDTQEAVSMACGSEDAHPSTIPLKKAAEIAKHIHGKEGMKKILKLAGRFRRIADHAKKSPLHAVSDTIVDTQLGNRLENLIGSERSKLAHPILRKETFARVLDKRAICWKKEARPPVGRGPVIMAVDNSGSMSGPPIEWAKAVAMVLYREAAKRKQPMHYIQFSSGGNEGIQQQTFEAGKDGEEMKFLKFSEVFLDGGTDYELPMDAIITKYGDGTAWADRADVIFVSDGEFPIDEIQDKTKEFREVAKTKHAMVYGVFIGSGEGAKTLEVMCDNVWGIDPNDADGAVMDIFRRTQ